MPDKIDEAEKKQPVCGIIMPISDCDGLGHSHWSDVLLIIRLAAASAGFEARLVSDTFESNLIHKEILSNVYNDDIIICDVSGRNPNVFFELGIRMATQKPTVIIKDDQTVYPFDTSPNRYIEYPRDLRHPGMEKFKKDLVSSLNKTLKQDISSSFIGQLGPFQIPKIESQETSVGEVVLQKLTQIERRIDSQQRIHTSDKLNQLEFKSKVHLGNSMAIVRENPHRITLLSSGYPKEMVENGIHEVMSDPSLGLGTDADVEIKKIDANEFMTSISASSPILKKTAYTIFTCIDEAIPF